MELRHFRYFIAVAEEMNFHRAAQRLNISQPPLSVTIAQLEGEIGVLLFSREKKKIALTDAGKRFLIHARDVMSHTDAAVTGAQLAADGKVGCLSFAFVGSSITGYLQNAMRLFQDTYPDVDIDLIQANNQDIVLKLENGELDFGVMRLPVNIPVNFKIYAEQKDHYCLAVPDNHPLSRRSSVTISDIAKEDLILFPRKVAPKHYDHIISMFLDHGYSPNIVLETREQNTTAALISSGIGISIVPSCVKAMPIPHITHIDITGIKQDTGIAVLAPISPSSIVRNFINSCEQQF